MSQPGKDTTVTQMQAGRELDALVAEKVFGATRRVICFAWADRKKQEAPHIGFLEVPAGTPWGHLRRSFNSHAMADGSKLDRGVYFPAHYSTSIADAWLVVEKMREHPAVRFRNLTLTAYCYNRTYATFDADAMGDYDPTRWAEANGEHATPLAICRAALLASGVR